MPLDLLIACVIRSRSLNWIEHSKLRKNPFTDNIP